MNKKLFKSLFLYITLVCPSFSQTTLDVLISQELVQKDKPVRLHLGCGEMHHDGYINIDFPIENHTIQKTSGADFFCDITKLSFPFNSISEIRNHHMFEHFSRGKALALLTAWHLWLKKDGILFIETPDFKESIKQLLSNRYTYSEKQTIIRHIFGSQEASWALHYDGWYDEKYESILEKFGFKLTSIKPSRYKVISNITIIANKERSFAIEELKRTSKLILAESLVDHSPSELNMLEVWFKEYNEALNQLLPNQN